MGERGAVAVEAAIIFPLLIMLFFGTLEFGLLFRNSHSISKASRSGARVASVLSRQDGYHLRAAEAVTAALSGVPDASIDQLIVFKATDGLGDGDPATCSDCYKFTWNVDDGNWNDPTGGWPANDQEACGGLNDTDYVGVYVEGHYDWATGLFGSTKTLSETTVMRLEPLPLSSTCS
jgi:hypothetical protein